MTGKLLATVIGKPALTGRVCYLALTLVTTIAAGCSTSETTPIASPAKIDNGEPATEVPVSSPGPTTGSGDTLVACAGSSVEIQSAMLQLINDFRTQPQNCGSGALPAADPFAWNDQLELAAERHSVDMSTHDFFSHTGSDGLPVSDRVTAAGYRWSNVGENIAGGQPDSQAATQAWIESEGHCNNLMNSDFKEFAVSCRSMTGTNLTHYWTMVFGTAR